MELGGALAIAVCSKERLFRKNHPALALFQALAQASKRFFEQGLRLVADPLYQYLYEVATW
jgi:hypothetical protein